MGPFNVLLIISRFRSDSLDPGYETLTNKGPRRGGPAPPPPPPPAGDVTAPVTSRSYGPRSYPPDSGRFGGGGYGGREPGYESLADLRDPDYESVITGAGRKKQAVVERVNILVGTFRQSCGSGLFIPDPVLIPFRIPDSTRTK
jgi:hypothetical protein